MMKNMKKTALLSIAVLLIVSVALSAMVGCSHGKDGKGVLSFGKIFDMSALSGIGLLQTSGVTPTMASAGDGFVLLAAETEAPKNDTASILTEELKADILKNLAIAENTLKGSAVKSESKESDKEGYTFSYTISAADMSGETKVYTFYCNRGETDEEGEETLIEGIVIMDGVEYAIRGEEKTEEDEQKFECRVSLSDTRYVEIEQETEKGERSFKYTSYENGEKVFESEVEFETGEDGEIELSFESETPAGEVEYSYSYYTEKDVSYVKVEIEKDGTETEVLLKTVTAEDGTLSYEFLEAEVEAES